MIVLPDKVRNVYNQMKRRCSFISGPYADVSVCEEWENDFNSFSEWYYKNLWKCKEPLQLDKDLLSEKKSKIYSPETCCLLPRSLNVFLSGKKRKNGLPVGVVKTKNGYRAQVNFMNGHIAGTFSDIEDAKEFYVSNKRRYLKMFIDAIRNDAPEHIIKALENYEF